ncbi:MAG: glycosyltransferase [Actinomycetaceae bacterium]|nr:glycosyltransferase [Actinomycetaceae bacterium]
MNADERQNTGGEAPLVAVVTRTRNRAELLERTLRSVAEQTHAALTHIVVNDGGQAGPIDELVAALPDGARRRVVRVDNAESVGREAAVNPGLAAARELGARYTTVLDDDDTWRPEFLATMVGRLEDRPEEIAAASGVDVVHEAVQGGAVVEKARERFAPELKQVVLSELLIRNYVPTMSLVFRTRALEALDGWRTDLPVLADWDFNLRLCMLGPIGYVDEPLAAWHLREDAEGDLGNSVVVAAREHRFYEPVVRQAHLRDGDGLALPLLLGGYVDRLAGAIGQARGEQTAHVEAVKAELQRQIGRLDARLAGVESRQEEIDRHLAKVGEQNAFILARLDEIQRDIRGA